LDCRHDARRLAVEAAIVTFLQLDDDSRLITVRGYRCPHARPLKKVTSLPSSPKSSGDKGNNKTEADLVLLEEGNQSEDEVDGADEVAEMPPQDSGFVILLESPATLIAEVPLYIITLGECRLTPPYPKSIGGPRPLLCRLARRPSRSHPRQVRAEQRGQWEDMEGDETALKDCER